MATALDSYAERAEAFIAELDTEYHLHFSGQKPEYEVEGVYERHAGLFDRGEIERLREAARDGDGDEARRAAYLLEFAVGGYLGQSCAAEEGELAAKEASLSLELADGPIPYRRGPVEQANAESGERRAEIEAARMHALSEELTPLQLAVLERSHSLITELGWPSYAAAYSELRGVDLEELARQTEAFLDATDDVFESVVGPELEASLGVGLDEVRRSDMARFFRAPALDGAFPSDRLIPSFEETMDGLGLGLDSQPNIVLDTEQRPTKTPRAYCAPVHVPDEVYLVVPRVGGREDYAAIFHEGGHAQHYANADRGLAAEYRYLGDNSVTESFAFLLEHITEEPRWISETLGCDPEPVASHIAAERLYFLRRYAAKLTYELELHSGSADLSRMPARYAELLGRATGIEWTPETWLDDVDGGFYVAAYLRAWALEERWAASLRERSGERWWTEPAAGEWLTGVWSQGQRLRAHELLAEETGEELRFDALASRWGRP